MASQKLISVIVPAFNAEKTLGKCVESILAQNYACFELIIVNDGSSDRTAAICDDYARKDHRVKVFHTENHGVASARNTALKEASGEYVCFVDSDDWVTINYIGNLVDGFEDGEADIVIAYPQYHKTDNVEIPEYTSLTVNSEDFEKVFIEHNIDWHTAPWAKMFKRDIISKRGIFFPGNMKIGEDCVFFFTYLLYADSVKIISSTDYCYNAYAEGTLTKRQYDTEYEKVLCENIIRVTDELIRIKNINNHVAISHLWRLKNNYIRRVLDSLYFSVNIISHKERMQVIHEYGPDAYDNLIKGDTLQGNIMKFMLRHHLYNTYDVVRMLARRIKR